MFHRRLFCMCAAMSLFVGHSAKAEPFNNDSIAALTSAGVGDDVLLSKIASMPCAYDLSTAEIIRLKKANVSNVVMAAMVDRCTGSSRAQGSNDSSSDPAVKRKPGLYLLTDSSTSKSIDVIRPTSVSGLQVSGNGSLVFPFVARLSVPRDAAQTKASPSPKFYFYFESSDNKTGDFGTSVSDAAQSPSEFNLIQFKVKSGQREIVIGKANAFNTKIGIDPKNTMPFSMSEIGDGIFEVTPNTPLTAGQYAFILRAGNDAFRIYDFYVN